MPGRSADVPNNRVEPAWRRLLTVLRHVAGLFAGVRRTVDGTRQIGARASLLDAYTGLVAAAKPTRGSDLPTPGKVDGKQKRRLFVGATARA